MYYKQIDYNSMDLDSEQVLMYLTMGLRHPQNDFERKMLRQIVEIEKKGGSVDIPFVD